MTDNIDWSFIQKHEGFSLTGYIPEDHGTPIGNSGVTIANGVDLGQMTQSSLEELNLSDDLTNLLSPFVGLKQLDAVSYLSSNMLTISQEQSDQLMSAIEDKNFNELSVIYDEYSDVNYENLTSAQQTVIMDVHYQYGNLAARCPKFWSAVTQQQWSQTIDILRDFGDSYKTRRNSEADLLS